MPAQNRDAPILAEPADPQAVPARGGRVLGTLLLGVLTLVVLGSDLRSVPYWRDESAYISQSYFFDLFLQGARDDPAWISMPALDLPPLEKYLIGLMLRIRGYPRPDPREAMAWYNDPSHRSETPEMLLAARWPSVILGTFGCIAVLGLGPWGATGGPARSRPCSCS